MGYSAEKTSIAKMDSLALCIILHRAVGIVSYSEYVKGRNC
ncbi:MAG: hypothetical protein ACOX7X_02190 [Methanosarcina flavescens]|nr:hypothetical protein [Methanosarcina flavescens]